MGNILKLYDFERKMNMYPTYKKVAIEAMRAFVLTFASQAVVIYNVQPVKDSISKGLAEAYLCLAPYNSQCLLTNSLWSNLWVFLIVPAGAAGIKGLIKYLRETYTTGKVGIKDYDSTLFKIPV